MRVFPVRILTNGHCPKAIQFFCTQDYSRKTCTDHIIVLERELARYPVEQLGTWSFVLAPSDSWKDVVSRLGGDPDSPAFSVIERRTSIFEEALFSVLPARRAELLGIFKTPTDTMLRLAVSHELGHAICKDIDEHRADSYGRDLRAGRVAACGQSTMGP